MNILERITAAKREVLKVRKTTNPASTLERSVYFKRQMPSFHEALETPGPSIIGEFKRQSPSKGIINMRADIRQVAKGYQAAGVAAMSVLTDEEFFGGTSSDLQEVAGFLQIPLLRKDFIIDEYQVIEAKSAGAAAILLIAAILNKKEIEILSGLATDLGMDILFEIHDEKELDKLNEKIRIVGVNNRDLKNFEINPDKSAGFLQRLPKDCLKVAESGFHATGDVKMLHKMGYDAFLIGENFMKTEDPGIAAARFINDLMEKTG